MSERMFFVSEDELRTGAKEIVAFMRRAAQSKGSFIMTQTGQIDFEDYAGDLLVKAMAAHDRIPEVTP
ncbi:MAG: hypothetical protein IPK85_02320 [Gemmatimonadetes bacterium]|nr:hypothetical protein [Gemmatimonadota bacterium]